MPVSLGVEDRGGSGLKEEKRITAPILISIPIKLTACLFRTPFSFSFLSSPHSFKRKKEIKNTHYHPWLSTILYILRVLTYLSMYGYLLLLVPIKTKK
jgi:hypothetical protein